jgi:DNA-binding beta-propeller fold protein YncE
MPGFGRLPPDLERDGTDPFGPATPGRPRVKRSRLKLLVLVLLAVLVLGFTSVATWYLLNRKPITSVLPVITAESLPHYEFSIYGVRKPIGVAVSSSGDRVYVAETEGERVVRIFDGKGQPVGTAAPPKSTPSTRIPVYVALEPASGDLYVSDRVSQSIFVFDRDGRYRRTFTPRPQPPGWQPLGLAFDRQGDLYVTNVGEPFHEILEYGPDGMLKRTIGQQGDFDFPNGLAADADGNLFIADSNNGRVAEFDGSTRQVGAIAHGVGEGQLGLPRGLAIDDEQRLYVVDTSGQGVYIYKLGGQKGRPAFIGTAGSEGTGDGQLEYPFGVATDTRARMYVADWANDRVQVWTY